MRITTEYFKGDLVEVAMSRVLSDYPELVQGMIKEIFDVECEVVGFQYVGGEFAYFVQVEFVEVDDSREMLDTCIERLETDNNNIRVHMEIMFDKLSDEKRLLLLAADEIIGPVLEEEEEDEDLEDEELEEEE